MVRRSHHSHKSSSQKQRSASSSADLDEQYTDDRSELTPAQRYAHFRAEQQRRKSIAGQFARTLPFELDPFQIHALDALEKGDNVLVAAPTGAGKTVIADFAVFLAQHRHMKAFYTTPIKALSNQKYHELSRLYGSDNVGLLTGDISINSEAPIVVMTTEVLRNMLYEQSSTLKDLTYVVLDEIHYLGDKFRGQVWEEVIIHLPQSVKIVGLSATVSNIEDFGAWIRSVRGKTALIVSETRPVPLQQSVILQPSAQQEPELYDLYRSQEQESHSHTSDQRSSDKDNHSKRPLSASEKVNPELAARLQELDALAERAYRSQENRRHRRRRQHHSGHMVRHYYPSRWAIIDELDYLDLLPGIYFIFSRDGCERAVEQCINAGLTLTTEKEARRIREIADSMIGDTISVEDLKALGYPSFRFALEHGFACHHAGMIALFREIVEKVFELGLVKVVFATETLALGINMPARSVIIEKLDKFNGESRVPLTPGEYTQLTGRAGRRGIDTLGHAIVVDHQNFEPATLAALSSRRVYPLHSQFAATFNMAVNLLHDEDPQTARRTLDQSFAQWEANESAEEMRSELKNAADAVDGFEEALTCSHGNIKEFLLLREKLTNLERGERRRLKHTQFRTPLDRKKAFQRLDDEIADTRRQEREHPCNSCPDLNRHLKQGNRWLRARKRYAVLKDRYDSRTGIVSRRFDLICSVLQKLGYLDGDSHSYQLTWSGNLLRKLFTEQDLVLAECLVEHIFDHLNPQQLAAVVSGTVYEARRRDESTHEPDHFPGGRQGDIATAAANMEDIWEGLDYTVEEAGLDPLPQLDFGIVSQIFDWSSDKPIGQILDGTEIQPGDFVRTCKRLCDVLGQISMASHYLDTNGDELDACAQKAVSIINRGIVAYSDAATQPDSPHRETDHRRADRAHHNQAHHNNDDDWRVFDERE
jgi:ATP-dependent RNA helicase HelY